MAEQTHTFREPVKLEAEPKNLIFHTYEDLITWLDREIQFWSDLNDQINPHRPFTNDHFINPLLSRAQRCSAALQQHPPTLPSVEVRAEYQKAIHRFNTAPSLTHQSPRAIEIATLAATSPLAAWVSIALFARGSAPHQKFAAAEITDVTGLLSGLLQLTDNLQHPDQIAGRLDNVLGTLSNRWEEHSEKLFHDLQVRLDKADKNARRWRTIATGRHRQYKTLHNEHAARMEDIEGTFTTKMQLRASELYWSEKIKTHSTRAGEANEGWWWSMALGGFLLLAYWVALGYLQPQLPKSAGGAFNLIQTLLFAVPVVPYLWVLRTNASERKINRRMGDDAEERVAMIKTFLALEHENKASTEERFIVLNALFRPHTADSDETIPIATLEALKNAVQPKR